MKIPVSRPYSGTPKPGDPTNQPGQYPSSGGSNLFFGTPLPAGTGAPGSASGSSNVISDVVAGPASVSSVTTAPGTQGAVNRQGGPDTVTYSIPTGGVSDSAATVSLSVSGTQDSTGANDQGYASGGPQLPGLKGNEPQSGPGKKYQPGAGHVLRGGYSKGTRNR